MYDILQLNDMLVPELLDIAEQLKIQNAKKLDKQELIYKILDKQAVTASAVKNSNACDDKEGPQERSKRVDSKRPDMKKAIDKGQPPKRGRKKDSEPSPALPLKEE